jgi:hypothetical protein
MYLEKPKRLIIGTEEVLNKFYVGSQLNLVLFLTYEKSLRRAGLVQLVSASSPSHQVLGSKPSLCRISAGVRLCFGYSLPQTPLVWEPLALGPPSSDSVP